MPDRVFLITGASTGIGAATARAALADGYRLVLAARSEDRLAQLAERMPRERVLPVVCDVRERADQERMVEHALERFGQLDVVFANAGIGGVPGGYTGGDPEHWRDMILTNVYGAALTLRVTLRALRETRGHVLLTGSIAGRKTLPGSVYGMTKWAVSAMGYNLREELKGTGIRVTLIEPGTVDTPFFDRRPNHSLTPEDVARAVMYTVSQPDTVDVHELLVMPTPPA